MGMTFQAFRGSSGAQIAFTILLATSIGDRVTQCTAHERGVANAVKVGQNHFFLENKVVINFDFRSGAKKSGHLDYPFKSYGSKFVNMHKTCGEVGVKKKSHGYNFQFQASI